MWGSDCVAQEVEPRGKGGVNGGGRRVRPGTRFVATLAVPALLTRDGWAIILLAGAGRRAKDRALGHVSSDQTKPHGAWPSAWLAHA